MHAIDAADIAWRDARQLVLVTTSGWDADHGVLTAFELDHDQWRQVQPPTPVAVGRAGSAWGVGLHPQQPAGPIKKEGDGRSPAGVFRIGEAFGYAASERTALSYKGMRESDYCIDVSGSPLYNRIVDARAVGQAAISGSTEPMRRDIHADGDIRYKLGFVIEHNTQGAPQAGSCIFAHLRRSARRAHLRLHVDGRARHARAAWRGCVRSDIRFSCCCRSRNTRECVRMEASVSRATGYRALGAGQNLKARQPGV